MRVLWVDADENPWTEANGWQVLEDFGLSVQQVSSVAEAEVPMRAGSFDLLLVRAETSGVVPFLVNARKVINGGPKRVVLTSSTWSKEQFKTHSKTDGAADRYARVPMPPEGFLSLVADIFGCSVEDFAEFSTGPAKPAKTAKRKVPSADSEDVETLRKYLRIKEEQLEISEGERAELSLENERFQKEAHQLQLRMRELEHLHDEVSKKILQMEEERNEAQRDLARETEERERVERSSSERVKALENQAGDAAEKYENLRVRVRKDIRKIRENERDLEARLELLRKDSSTLLQARDEKVLEMQRKIDALEFDLDQVQDGRVQAQMEAERYLTKLSKVARALQLATGMIEEDQFPDEELEELEPVLGGAAMAEEMTHIPPLATSTIMSAAPALPAAGEPAPESVVAEEGAEPQNFDDLSALANDGEPTQMISAASMHMDEEPESSSG